LKFEIDAVNLQVGRLLMNGILNDERIATQQKMLEAKKLVSSQFQNQQSQISNSNFESYGGVRF